MREQAKTAAWSFPRLHIFGDQIRRQCFIDILVQLLAVDKAVFVVSTGEIIVRDIAQGDMH